MNKQGVNFASNLSNCFEEKLVGILQSNRTRPNSVVVQFSCIDYQCSCVCTRRPKRVKATRHRGRGTINMQKAHNNQQTNKDLIFEVAHEDLEIGNSKKLQAKALRSSKSSNKTGI